jgi:hypothetical protein
MKIEFWPQDTIARRFALTIVSAIVVALSLTWIAIEFSGVWGRPSAHEMGLLERADDIVRMVEAAPEQDRQALTDAVANNATFRADWYPAASTVVVMLDTASNLRTVRDQSGFMSGGHQRRAVYFTS